MAPALTTLLLFALGLGTTVTFASSHWLVAWMGLEINTLAILPLMARHHHPRAVEATTKYFLIQVTGAALLLFATCSNAWLTGEWEIKQTGHAYTTTVAMIALTLKLGLAPMHIWLPEVLQGLDLSIGLLLSTWQKLAPLILLVQITPPNSKLLIILGVASTLLAGWAGLNQTQIRKILAYSSIAHLGWMVVVIQYSFTLTLLTLLIYTVMTISAFLVFNMNKSTTINALGISWAKSPAITALTPLILLSLGGLPPLTGFMTKWLILQELTKQGLSPLATLTALSALLSLYFYLRLSYAMTLTMSPNNITGTSPWRLTSSKRTLPTATFTMATLLLLPLTPAITALLTQ
uniref:NADH-ubiquinone oxidoreductase chain 2 n=1 Tax=Parupeneus multifasciatus TaxID=626244 RepID=A0A060NSM2_9TELE|nr:NADH dehydrogenase subunit 2 [Parupeneus multifasciatus]WGO62574.1 NADH dehydrogenase subunit 2 [Parupeneus multifasciatus]BAO84772.1 NADH dehydrogenase subunit 2 [Parupeneus multifasciatus]